MTSLKEIIKTTIILLLVASCSPKPENVDVTVICEKEIKTNTEYIGKVIIEHSFDSIQLKEKDLRLTALYLMKSQDQKSIEYLNNLKDSLPIFGKIEEGNDTLYFAYEFKNEGVYYLEGVIEDTILLDNYHGNGESRNITNLVKISEKITVTNEINDLENQ